MSTTSRRSARENLSTPSSSGTLSLAYRRSVVALQSLFGSGSSQNYAEREPLLSSSSGQPQNGGDEGYSVAGPSSARGNGYGATEAGPSGEARRRIPKPKKVITQSKVEAKVWFANERTWISWLRVSILIGSFALALFNSSTFFNDHHHPSGAPQYPSPTTIKTFGTVYAAIAVLTLLWGLYSYQRRVTLIKQKWPGDFDDLVGPPLICAVLFVAVLLNFIVRVQQHNLESQP
ncbi:uncharacterized protein PFL1_01235 [Pseudozyma flocculosa PF-1]|uniref:Related to VTC1 \|nr:uncharacterized protein PFL1_01235 [Pseudozyma flocculosa PF-1]EPQ31046.1 hypothetical protein PFL1_01235 [Pseudozyma flocculosa PF-1]SPO35891.1 related to VTC1 \